MGNRNSIDYVAARIARNTQDGITIEDFVCVELQAAGTTGSPWQAVLDIKETGKYQLESYNFGINWANEFAKTMMQQAYRKGRIIEHWKRRVIFIIQDVALDYLQRNYNTSGLRPASDNDAIHFYTLRMYWHSPSEAWLLKPDKRLSTDTDGVRRMLSGLPSDRFPTVDEFIDNVKRKISSSSNSGQLTSGFRNSIR